VNPSDSAPALIALDAKFVMRTPKGTLTTSGNNHPKCVELPVRSSRDKLLHHEAVRISAVSARLHCIARYALIR